MLNVYFKDEIGIVFYGIYSGKEEDDIITSHRWSDYRADKLPLWSTEGKVCVCGAVHMLGSILIVGDIGVICPLTKEDYMVMDVIC